MTLLPDSIPTSTPGLVLRSVCVSVDRKKTERSKKFFTDLMAKEHIPTMINPKPCGHLCCCAITGCEEVTLVFEFQRNKSNFL